MEENNMADDFDIEVTRPKYHYSIEVFRNNQWVKETRTYYKEKSLTDFDLHDIPDKRRNATFISKT